MKRKPYRNKEEQIQDIMNYLETSLEKPINISKLIQRVNLTHISLKPILTELIKLKKIRFVKLNTKKMKRNIMHIEVIR